MVSNNFQDREIVIVREFDAPRQLVWDAMTDPEQVVKWWGPIGFSTTIEQMTVRPGGIWKHVMHGPDGTDYPNYSIFTEIVEPERIVYTHGGGKKDNPGPQSVVTWTFETLENDRTRVTIYMVFETSADRDRVVHEYGAIEGGKQTLARLGEQLERIPIILERTFNAPVAVIWGAITDPNQMRRWYFDVDVFKPEKGSKTRFNIRKDDKNFLHLWEVTEVIPDQKITYSWKFEGFPGESFLTWELFPEGSKTRLKLTHRGLETFLPRQHPDLARGNFLKGWTYIVGTSLTSFLEKTI